MYRIIIINIILLFSWSLNASGSMSNVFKSGYSASDGSSGKDGTRAEGVFGGYSTSSGSTKEAAAESPKESTKESTSGTSKGTASTLFGSSSKETPRESAKEASKGTASETAKETHRGRAGSVFGKSGSTESASAEGSNRSRASSVFGSKKNVASRSGAGKADTGKAEAEEQKRENTVPEDDNPRSRPNFMWPVAGGRINSFYGWRSSKRFHDGIDIVAPSGTKVFASKSGEVIYSDDKIRGYGNMVVIRHNGGISSVYAHNKTNLVNKGSIVRQGDVIAYVGSTGHSSGPHSHFEIRKGKYSSDPMKYLSSRDIKKHSGAYANSADNPF